MILEASISTPKSVPGKSVNRINNGRKIELGKKRKGSILASVRN